MSNKSRIENLEARPPRPQIEVIFYRAATTEKVEKVRAENPDALVIGVTQCRCGTSYHRETSDLFGVVLLFLALFKPNAYKCLSRTDTSYSTVSRNQTRNVPN